MGPRKFVKAVETTVNDDGLVMYKQTFARPGVVTDEYWARALDLYRSLSRTQRKTLFEIMRQVQVDTVSEMFGIFDGSSGLDGRSEHFELFHRSAKSRVRLDGDLQDLFLERVESSS